MRHFYQAGMDLWGGIQTRLQGGIHFHNVAAIGQADPIVKNILTSGTRHGLAPKLDALQCLGWDLKAVYRIRLVCCFLR